MNCNCFIKIIIILINIEKLIYKNCLKSFKINCCLKIKEIEAII